MHGRLAQRASGLRNNEQNTAPEMVWVRTDGRRIADDPALLQRGKADVALCQADLDPGSANETARTCMAQRGYALVQKDQAEELRAAYATAAQRTSTPTPSRWCRVVGKAVRRGGCSSRSLPRFPRSKKRRGSARLLNTKPSKFQTSENCGCSEQNDAS